MNALGMTALRAGDIGFGPIGGFVPGFFPVDVGQALLAATKRVEWNIDHVFVVTRAFERTEDRETGTGWLHRVQVVQAMPSGAEEISIGQEHWTDKYVYVRPAYDPGQPFEIGYENRSQGFKVAYHARKYIDTPYSFLDYAAIAGLHAGIRNGPIRRYVTSSKHMICSQLADQALTDAGFHVFTDGRLPQDVMPVELYRKLAGLPGTQYLRPGSVNPRFRPVSGS